MNATGILTTKNMKIKPHTPQETQEKIILDFDPPLPGPYSIVSQIMPGGTKELLGYISRDEFPDGKDSIYYAYDLNLMSIGPATAQWQEINAGFEKYVRQVSQREREIKEMRRSK